MRDQRGFNANRLCRDERRLITPNHVNIIQKAQGLSAPNLLKIKPDHVLFRNGAVDPHADHDKNRQNYLAYPTVTASVAGKPDIHFAERHPNRCE